MNNLRSAIASAEVAAKDSMSALSLAMKQRDHLQDSMEALRAQHAEQLRLEAVQRDADRADAESRIAELSQQRDSLMAELHDAHIRANDDEARLKDRSMALQRALDASTACSMSHEKQLMVLETASLKSLEALKAEHHAERDLLKGEISQLQAGIKSERQKAMDEIKAASSKAADLATSRDDLIADMSLLQQQLVEMEARLASEHLQFEAASSKATAEGQRVVDLEVALSSAMEDICRWIKCSDARALEVASLEADLAGVTSGYKYERNEARHRLVALGLHDELVAVRQDMAKLQADLLEVLATSGQLLYPFPLA